MIFVDASRLEKQKEVENSQEQPQSFKEWLEESKGVAKRLGSSKVYILNNISGACFLFGIMGFALFAPKFIEFHYRQKASTSGASGGIPKTLASVIGMLVSGWIIGKNVTVFHKSQRPATTYVCSNTFLIPQISKKYCS